MTDVGKHILAIKMQASHEMNEFGEKEGHNGAQHIALIMIAEFIDLLVDQYGWPEDEVLKLVNEIREQEKDEITELLQ